MKLGRKVAMILRATGKGHKFSLGGRRSIAERANMIVKYSNTLRSM
jgi:hypothetical protein